MSARSNRWAEGWNPVGVPAREGKGSVGARAAWMAYGSATSSWSFHLYTLSTKSKVVFASAASVILAAVLWDYFERAGSVLNLPGAIVTAVCSGRFKGGFGDRRDFLVIVGASWSF
jgi:hypothetical protein